MKGKRICVANINIRAKIIVAKNRKKGISEANILPKWMDRWMARHGDGSRQGCDEDPLCFKWSCRRQWQLSISRTSEITWQGSNPKSVNVHYRKLNLLTTRFLCVVWGLCELAWVLGCACVGEGK